MTLLLFANMAYAHPPIGIVCDSQGNIYYSDLSHVWKIEASGGKVVAVANVHTHELCIDGNDNLYGQGSIYSGERTNKWYYYIWRLNKQGRLDTIVPVTEGFYILDYSFARDISGAMYWIKHVGPKTSFMKTSSLGTKKITDGDFKRVQWIHVWGQIIYFVNHDNIYKMDQQGSIQTILPKLNGSGNRHNSIFGIWTNAQGELHFANTDKRIIQKRGGNGKLTTVYRSEGTWYPTSGTFDKKGNMWVLEGNEKNEIRALRVN